jgi:hypothetical protein
MDKSSFEQGKGYWVYVNEAGNLTLSSVGGSLAGQTYAWNKLRFMNGSLELNITEAGNMTGSSRQYMWITSFKYWGYTAPEDPDAGFDFIDMSSGNFNAWQGYFIKSNYDNITLIRQN